MDMTCMIECNIVRIFIILFLILHASSVLLDKRYLKPEDATRVNMYVKLSNLSYPIMLFADMILGGSCITLTSRFHTDGRQNYDIKKLNLYIKLHQNLINDQKQFIRLFPTVYKSYGIGRDTPVQQLLFCNPSLTHMSEVEVKIRYVDSSRRFTTYYLKRLVKNQVDVAACTMTSLQDIWSAQPWIEFHRTLGIQRFNVFVNDFLPPFPSSSHNKQSPYVTDKQPLPFTNISRITLNSLSYLLAQDDVEVIEWPYPFKDPNTTRDKVLAPLHYARPLEWNSCNERERHGARFTLFSDMDEYLVLPHARNENRHRTLLDIAQGKPAHCRGLHIGHHWVKLKCPCRIPSQVTSQSPTTRIHNEVNNSDNPIYNNTQPGFDDVKGKHISKDGDCDQTFHNLSEMNGCEMWRHPVASMDRKRRMKLLVRSERGDVHDVLNHDLGSALPVECAFGLEEATIHHIINLRPMNSHVSAGKWFDLNRLMLEATIPIKINHHDLSPPQNHSPTPPYVVVDKSQPYSRMGDTSSLSQLLVEQVSRHDSTKRSYFRPIYITVSTSPTRIQYLHIILDKIDLHKYDNIYLIVNLPKYYGHDQTEYSSKYLVELLQFHPNLFIHWIPSDWGPFTKLLPTLELVKDPKAIIISVDDDTRYPLHFLDILLRALVTSNYSMVIGLCGVNISSWGLQDGCYANRSTCKPWDTPYPLQHVPHSGEALRVMIPDFGWRKLTPVHVLKGFTGVAFPRALISEDIIRNIHSWRTQIALEADQLTGLPYDSCFQSDDLVINAALHLARIPRYRISLTNDCREGLAQYEFGFGNDALMIRNHGHTAKYFACSRALSFYLSLKTSSRTLQTYVSSGGPIGEDWPSRTFDYCVPPQVTSLAKHDMTSGLTFRWKKWWYYPKALVGLPRRRKPCWKDRQDITNENRGKQQRSKHTVELTDSRRSQNNQKKTKEFDKYDWSCPFPLTLPHYSDFKLPLYTIEGVPVHPISYAFQLNRIPHKLRNIKKDWSIIWPVQAINRLDPNRGYVFNNESEYYNEYASSLFAYTYRKGGWDSMRHYEILCNGGIPFFIDIDSIPRYTMVNFPKEIISHSMKLPGIDPIGTISTNITTRRCLGEVRQVLHGYCKRYLSTISLAKYVLLMMNKNLPEIKSILMINGRNQWEYLTDSLFHGLKSIFGSQFIDVHKRSFLYYGGQEESEKNGFHPYGKGFSYAWSLLEDPSMNRSFSYISDGIRSHRYDLIVIGQVHQPVPMRKDWMTSQDITRQLLWEDISSHYSKNEIVCLDGLDTHSNRQRDFLLSLADTCTLFVREIDDIFLHGLNPSLRPPPGSVVADNIFHLKRTRDQKEK